MPTRRQRMPRSPQVPLTLSGSPWRRRDTAARALRLRVMLVVLVSVAATACGKASARPEPQTAVTTAENPASASQTPAEAAAAAAPTLVNWPEFGLNPQRSDASNASPGIDAANLRQLHEMQVGLPGTVDSSPIYAHGVTVDGATHNVILVTTTYGKTVAIDAESGHILWIFTPAGYRGWAGSAQITTTTPLADPGGKFVYAASPNGLIHKLLLSNGAEQRAGGWPVSVTRDPTHEKLAGALNVDGSYLLVVTGGYIGDIPPYQGHVVAIERTSGQIRAVFNTLCANRRTLITPSSCPASDSAIWGRGGAVVEANRGRILVTTGNGPWNGTTNFGDSALELTIPGLRLRQAYAPTNQAELNSTDDDLGSGSPALLSEKEVLIGGKDGWLRVLALAHMDGRRPSAPRVLGGEVQRLRTPGGNQLLTQSAVWHHSVYTTVFVADGSGTAAFALREGRLRRLWENNEPGTSPIWAGDLLYVYNPSGGGINVYRSSSPKPVIKLPGAPGHWNSPIVVDGHVVEPEGDANQHELSGQLAIFSLH